MPEGPSIVILKEEAQGLTGKKIIAVSGNTKVDVACADGKKVLAFKSWGKHFLICFNGFTIRIHFMLFGSYRINEGKATPPRLSLQFKEGEINFYACSVKILEGDINSHYDWSADVMNDAWDAEAAKAKLALKPDMLACDALLEQDIFSGVGNIIKNEVLYRIFVHPEAKVGSLPPEKVNELVNEARIYSFQFLEWKKKYELKKHWLAHTKKTCVRCRLPLIKKITGTKKRRSFFCPNCQAL
ncbi:endonuclease [Flavobacterium cyanobacteriorum]|uniref:Endonuclease n=1 Tax=Flavobacterium cyanobacteriorum TaxID=2022802 RepID=A0A256A5N8_9FLAO|nr:DNA-formamidopyrimidine glycosylase family protein [Flavobacterium cyanobacteriorum]OYQ48941.1 endonuclease [Flavobacterium cyanobacteriorum]